MTTAYDNFGLILVAYRRCRCRRCHCSKSASSATAGLTQRQGRDINKSAAMTHSPSLALLLSTSSIIVGTSNAFLPSKGYVQHPTTQARPQDIAATIPVPFSSAIYSEPNGSSNTGISFGSAGASLLNDAFSALSQSDQYDAVLTGLCAKILDGEQKQTAAPPDDNNGDAADIDGPTGFSAEEAQQAARLAALSPTERAFATLSDPLSLLREMNGRRVRASPRSLSALIDATVVTESAAAMAAVLSLGKTNGGIRNYGSLQSFVTPIPTNPNARIVCPDGVSRTRDERLSLLQDVPTDDRTTEVTAAMAAMGVLGFCIFVRLVGGLFGLEDLQGPADLVIGTALTVGIVDNFYDALKGGTSLLASTQRDRMPDAIKDASLPDKEDVPLGLGQGKITGTVVRGLTRLLSVDTERECQCEAAALFVAYALGLPCFAFRPNALEGAVLIFESTKQDSYSQNVDSLLSDAGILKVLIWIMAPVAMENGRHAHIIASDPREGAGLLRRLRERAGSVSAEAVEVVNDLLGGGDPEFAEQNADAVLRWAHAEADALLRDNRSMVEELTERLAGGAATVGDCTAVLEDW